MFSGETAPAIADITDGTSNTLLVVEVKGRGVHWAEPTDLDFQQFIVATTNGNPTFGLSEHPGGFQAALCDGSVRFTTNTTDLTTLSRLVQHNDGQVIPAY